MDGGAATFWGWGIGIVVLGLVLAYAAMRSGRLRPGERARLDENTRASLHAHDQAERATGASSRVPGMQSNTPYALLIPIIVVAAAIALMFWSFAGDRTPRQDAVNQQNTNQQTTGNAAPKQAQPTAPAPRNDTAGDSARGNGPLNRSQ
ncbi:conserved hypothetical protein [Bradyrhizobium oligotrophicum S58]|uniref:Uncharacterized protein n=1 Tax=Bradyrhizobium oligotrophicum S58 TaxID=1245469 RepID=M4Z8P7_9BRAD|nr:hypothetical protein [Bradyrhizobium oligotrophicum]BAM90043.1 conserved hypothetical protein [Bradyrhizobium oligotrophicum S58]